MISMVNKVLDRYYSSEDPVGISPSAFLVLVTLARECSGEFGFAQVSTRRMKELTKLGSTNTIMRALRELEAKGFILPLNSSAKNYTPALYMLLPAKNDEKNEKKSRPKEKQEESINDLLDELGKI